VVDYGPNPVLFRSKNKTLWILKFEWSNMNTFKPEKQYKFCLGPLKAIVSESDHDTHRFGSPRSGSGSCWQYGPDKVAVKLKKMPLFHNDRSCTAGNMN
jgi:hypothetical protein